MFGVLLESRAARVRRTGGMVLSVASHAAVLCGAVAFTANARQPARDNPETWPDHVFVREPVEQYREPTRRNTERMIWSEHSTFEPRRRIDVDLGAVVHGVPPIDSMIGWPSRPTNATAWCARVEDCRVVPNGGIIASTALDEARSGSELMARMLGAPPRPRYPELLRAAGVSGRVVVQFTVDTTGHVEANNVRVLQSTHELFTQAVLDVLPRFRFVAAEVDGRRVRMLAQMPFEFTLERR